MLTPRENNLPLKKERWSGSSPLVNVRGVQSDLTDQVSLKADFETVASNSAEYRPAEVVAELEVILAKSEYNLELCLNFTSPIP